MSNCWKSHVKAQIFFNLCVKMTAIRNQKTHGNYKKNVYCSFNSFATTIFVRNLEYIDLNGDVTMWQIITMVSRVKLIVYYTSFFIHESYLVRF